MTQVSKDEPFNIYCWDAKTQQRQQLSKNLLKVISTKFYPPYVLKQDAHFIYLLDFLEHHNVQCAIVENKYFSQSYIEDYHQRFFLGLTDYDRYSKRVHFFKIPPPAPFLKNFKTKQNIFLDFKDARLKDFWEEENYIGNIFLRPLPQGLIGVTIMRPYEKQTTQFPNSAKPERNYPATHSYKINLFGVERQLDSLIYTSQDSIAGACATAALFSAFYKYATLFRTPILSPGSITSQGKLFQDEERLFPNKGLTSLQMKSAIQAIGLECEILNYDDAIKDEPFVVNEIIMAYLRCGLPVIFSFQFPNTNDYHAVAICGYSLVDEGPNEVLFKFCKGNESLPQIRSRKFVKFYAHDDQVGPFSRIYIKGTNVISGWWEDNKKPNIKTAVEFTDLMVAYPDVIKVGYLQVRRQVMYIHTLFVFLKEVSKSKLLEEISWDIFLDESNKYKSDMLAHKPKDASTYAVFDCLPKYVWIVKCFGGNDLLFHLILDSTSLDATFSPLKLIILKDSVSNSLSKIFKSQFLNVETQLKKELSKSGDNWIIPMISFLHFFHEEMKSK